MPSFIKVNMKYLVLLLLLSFSTPIFAENTASWAPWIPAGWGLLSSATGDLNKDGAKDAVLVLEEKNPAKIKPNDGLGAKDLNLNSRRLLILFNTPQGYQKAFSSDRLLPTENDADLTCLEDPLGDGRVSVSRGVLVLSLNYWLSCGSYAVTNNSFTFRYENSRFRLIGFDQSEFSRSTGDQSEISINYLTGKMKLTTGLNSFEESKPKVAWQPISGEHNFYLDKIRLDCGEYVPDFGCQP